MYDPDLYHTSPIPNNIRRDYVDVHMAGVRQVCLKHHGACNNHSSRWSLSSFSQCHSEYEWCYMVLLQVVLVRLDLSGRPIAPNLPSPCTQQVLKITYIAYDRFLIPTLRVSSDVSDGKRLTLF